MGFGQPLLALGVLIPVISAGLLKPCQSGDLPSDDTSCTNFYFCKDGVKVPAFCPIGKYFDPGAKACLKDTDVASKCEPDTIIIEILRQPSTELTPIARFQPVIKSKTITFLKPKNRKYSSDSENFSSISTEDLDSLQNFSSDKVSLTTVEPKSIKRSDLTSMYTLPDLTSNVDAKPNADSAESTKSISNFNSRISTPLFTSRPRIVSVTTVRSTQNSSKPQPYSDTLSDINVNLDVDFQYTNSKDDAQRNSENNTAEDSNSASKTRLTRDRRISTTPISETGDVLSTTSIPSLINMYNNLISNLSSNRDISSDLNKMLGSSNNSDIPVPKSSGKYNAVISFLPTQETTIAPNKARTTRTLNFMDAYLSRDHDYLYPYSNPDYQRTSFLYKVEHTTPHENVNVVPRMQLTTSAAFDKIIGNPLSKKHVKPVNRHHDHGSDYSSSRDLESKSKSGNLDEDFHFRPSTRRSPTITRTTMAARHRNSQRPEYNMYTDLTDQSLNQNVYLNPGEETTHKPTFRLKGRTKSIPKTSTAKPTVTPVKHTDFMNNMYSDLSDMPSKSMKNSNPEATSLRYLKLRTTSAPKHFTTSRPKHTTVFTFTKRPSLFDMYPDITDTSAYRNVLSKHTKSELEEKSRPKSTNLSIRKSTVGTKMLTTAMPATKATKRPIHIMNMYSDMIDMSSYRDFRDFDVKYPESTTKQKTTTEKTTTHKIETPTRSAISFTKLPTFLNMYSDLMDFKANKNIDHDMYPKYQSKYSHPYEKTPHKSHRIKSLTEVSRNGETKSSFRHTDTPKSVKKSHSADNMYADLETALPSTKDVDVDRNIEEKDLEWHLNEMNSLENDLL